MQTGLHLKHPGPRRDGKSPATGAGRYRDAAKGQAFALLEGGQLWKIRMPLPAGDADDVLMPESIEKIAEEMRRSYHSGESWWRDGPALNVPVTGGANG